MTHKREKEIRNSMYIEGLDWTCSCGTPMYLEINNFIANIYDLDCRRCGLVGYIKLMPKVRPPSPKERKIADL